MEELEELEKIYENLKMEEVDEKELDKIYEEAKQLAEKYSWLIPHNYFIMEKNWAYVEFPDGSPILMAKKVDNKWTKICYFCANIQESEDTFPCGDRDCVYPDFIYFEEF